MADETEERERQPNRPRAAPAGARREGNPADEHKKDREELRSRERARRMRGERDHRRERQRPRRDDDERSSFGGVVRDADWLAHSLTRASTRAVFGTVRVLEDLFLNMADSYYAYPDRRDEDEEPESDDDRRPRGRRARTVERYRSSFAQYTSDLYDDLSQAIRDEADVLARAGNEFSREREDERDRDADAEEDRTAEAIEDVAEDERRRRRTAAPPEPA